jgi:hypothetical protein
VIAETFVETRDESKINGDPRMLQVRSALTDQRSTKFVEFAVSLIECEGSVARPRAVRIGQFLPHIYRGFAN